MSKLVVLDAGHGGADSGAVGNGLKEDVLTLKLVKKVRFALLRDFDVDVKLTRDDDTFVTLPNRARFANDLGADFFVAIHCNSGGGTGYEDFVQPNASERTRRLRREMHRSIAAFLETEDVVNRGKKTMNLAVLRRTRMPAVLTECLFVDSAADAANLRDDDFLTGLARAHARGIARALQLPRIAVPVG
jgi:N-acetylmuramoyl-L-alanine amidase